MRHQLGTACGGAATSLWPHCAGSVARWIRGRSSRGSLAATFRTFPSRTCDGCSRRSASSCGGRAGVTTSFIHPEVRELVNLQEVCGQAKPYHVRQVLRVVERYASTRRGRRLHRRHPGPGCVVGVPARPPKRRRRRWRGRRVPGSLPPGTWASRSRSRATGPRSTRGSRWSAAGRAATHDASPKPVVKGGPNRTAFERFR